MLQQTKLNTTATQARDWIQALARYREPNQMRSVLELIITGAPFVVLWVIAWFALSISYWLTLAISVPAAGFLVRLFLIQHDCGHGSFFRSHRVSNTVGFFIGVMTLTPYHYWRKTHAYHHAHSGDLDFRGFGDIDTMTLREFMALSRGRRLPCTRRAGAAAPAQAVVEEPGGAVGGEEHAERRIDGVCCLPRPLVALEKP